MEKFLIELYECYGSSCEITKKEKSFVIDSMDELEEALEDIDCEWLIDTSNSEYENFANGNSTIAIIEDSGDWDDPTGYKLVRYSYEEKLQQLQKTYQKELEELNKLFNI